MNRNHFIKSTSLALGGIFIGPPAFGRLKGIDNSLTEPSFVHEDMQWKIDNSGHFSLVSGNISITDCFPSFGNKPLKAKQVKVALNKNGGVITYILHEGKMELNLSKDHDSLFVQAKLTGMKFAPHTVCPISQASITVADQFYKQGLGFAGPSGLFPIKKGGVKPWEVIVKEEAWSYDSFMTFGLVSANNSTIAVAAYYHDNFVNRHTIYNHTHRKGLNDYTSAGEATFMDSAFITENIPVPVVGLVLPAIHLVAGNKPFGTLNKLASNIALASKARTHQPPKYHFCSWLEYYEDYDVEKLDDLLNGLKSINPPLNIQTIQIDGGYNFAGDWLLADPGQYPGGMENAIHNITKAGYKAGIWIAPFAVSSHSQLFKQHPEWVLKYNNGSLVTNAKGKPFLDNKSTYDEVYTLDTSHPGAMAYLKNIFVTLKSWGITYFKTDFMDWGLVDSTEVIRHSPGKSSAQYYTELMKEIRASIGEDSFWLGCISPFGQMVGFADGMRVSNDAGTDWNVGSTVNMLQESHAAQYFNNVLWQNDPDIITFRNSTLVKLTEEEVFSIAVWSAISGSIVTTSDRFHKLSVERRNLLRFVEPHASQKLTGLLPYWEKGKERIICTRKYEGSDSWAIFIFNTTEKTIHYNLSLKEITGIAGSDCYSWKPKTLASLGKREQLEGQLKPHHSALFYVTAANIPPLQNMGLNGEKINFE